MKNYGFTIVELLIVIVVIAILATITIVAYNGIQICAKSTAVADGLRKMDTSLHAWAVAEGFNRWPDDDPLSQNGMGLSLATFKTINTPPYNSFRDFIGQVPSVQGINTQDWFYDQDEDGGNGDDKTACSASNALMLTGVNVVVLWIKEKEVAEKVNSILENDVNGDGTQNLSCGKVRWYPDATNGGAIIYAVSYTKNV